MPPSKNELRQTLLAQRKTLAVSEAAALSFCVCERLRSLQLAPGAVIAGYVPMRNEVDIMGALGSFHEGRNSIVLPVVSHAEKILEFREWHPNMILEQGGFGTQVPTMKKIAIPDILCVPLVGFDRRGHRIGYGQGYYDATLAHLRAHNPPLLAIGIAYDFQEVDAVLESPYDVALDSIVTNKEVISCR